MRIEHIRFSRPVVAALVVSMAVSAGANPFLSILSKSVNSSTEYPAFTSFTGGTLANNLTFDCGMWFTPSTGMTVTQLARWVISGNSQRHTLTLWGPTTNVLATVSVNCSGATTGAWLYGTLSSSVALTSGQTYYVTSSETNGGDQWYDYSSTITANATYSSSVSAWELAYYLGGTMAKGGSSGRAYGPVNFKFTIP